MKRLILLLFLLPLFSFAQDTIVTGAEHLLSDTSLPVWETLKKGKIGIVGNQTSVVGENNTHLVDTLRAKGVRITTIFCPEHGFRGQAEAGARVQDGKDARTGIPIISLYGKNKKPSLEQLKGIDLVLFDLQDVGCRFYTYISTLTYVMEACAEANVPLVILDRPNPNAHYVDGPVLKAQYKSFVGMHPVPIVYGMTIGEYGKMVLGERWLWMTTEKDTWKQLDSATYAQRIRKFSLTVVELQHYTHATPYALPVAPSPNLQNDHAIKLYPSLCLFEGTNVSVGRGTKWPFELLGTPNYHGSKPFTFTPVAIPGVSENPPFKEQLCRGLDLRSAKPLPQIDLSYLITMYRYTNPRSDFFLKNDFFSKLAGTATLRKQIEKFVPEDAIRNSWQRELKQFSLIRSRYLIYK